ncbi:hypothetical protein BC941DRAFT_473622 [Chlamydoabsidia padenii]|nr:hypothetical protein BC941DRAFT_473622 [Chlamydoabsidia padenii]
MNPSTTATSKKLHYASLQTQLERLNQNMKQVNKNIQVMAEHAPAIQNIGTLHTALSLSASKVLNHTNYLKGLPEQDHQ